MCDMKSLDKLTGLEADAPAAMKAFWAARLENGGEKTIVSYRIGWAYVHPYGIEFHAGALMSVPEGIEPGRIQEVPDQAVPFDARAERVIFFVAELTFADGGRWKTDHEDIEHEAGLESPAISLSL
jgi:hypothetical protein